jgi:hydrogenase maturation protein HypF
VRLPGGERAIREPWRMACAWMIDAAGPGEDPSPGLVSDVSPSDWRAVAHLVRTGVAAPLTSSVGRLFDAIAALCHVRSHVNYEGQAAVELEAVADRTERGAYPLPVLEREGGSLLDARATVRAVADDLAGQAGPALVAARFHNALARATAQTCVALAGAHGLDTVVLSGGVFQNRLLLERTAAPIAEAGLHVLTPEHLPPNDGGIAYGQAAVAASRCLEGVRG